MNLVFVTIQSVSQSGTFPGMIANCNYNGYDSGGSVLADSVEALFNINSETDAIHTTIANAVRADVLGAYSITLDTNEVIITNPLNLKGF